MKCLLLLLFIAISNCCFAQSYRISENPKVKEVDVFIAPGITPKGQRLMQFSFIKVKKLKTEIKTDKILLFTEGGIEVLLINSIKDTSYQSNIHSKVWFASYALSEADIATLRQSKITHIQILVGKKSRKFPVSSTASIEMNKLIASKF